MWPSPTSSPPSGRSAQSPQAARRSGRRPTAKLRAGPRLQRRAIPPDLVDSRRGVFRFGGWTLPAFLAKTGEIVWDAFNTARDYETVNGVPEGRFA